MQSIVAFWNSSQKFKLHLAHKIFNDLEESVMIRLELLRLRLKSAHIGFSDGGKIWAKL